ncbi:MAG: phosphoribosyltransferase family protein [Candidatus Obscuribacterales bacterium]|nr:phosphoribosyltransferase family protein [Candidatus Obscuribacterales bacterium]
MFLNREQAGTILAKRLAEYISANPNLDRKLDIVVVALPRGGVPVALEVARKFGCRVELIVAKKLSFPGQSEVAIGAVSSDGVVVLNPNLPSDNEWQEYIETQRQGLLISTKQMEQDLYAAAGYAENALTDKIVFVIDDGVATGMTAVVAVETARRRGAAHVIVAAPVMSLESYHYLHAHCDNVVALSTPEPFSSVGFHYSSFDQTTDQEVVAAMKESINFATPMLPLGRELGAKTV